MVARPLAGLAGRRARMVGLAAVVLRPDALPGKLRTDGVPAGGCRTAGPAHLPACACASCAATSGGTIPPPLDSRSGVRAVGLPPAPAAAPASRCCCSMNAGSGDRRGKLPTLSAVASAPGGTAPRSPPCAGAAAAGLQRQTHASLRPEAATQHNP